MNVRVRLFAAARQAAGSEIVEVELPEDPTIGQLRRRLAEAFPELSAVVKQAMFAVDAQYCRDAEKIRPGADVACIPPVSGG